MALEIYTDGACIRNGKPDSIGTATFIVVEDNKIVEEYTETRYGETSNAMELQAIANALHFCQRHGVFKEGITIYSDSSYCINGITKWIEGWHGDNWKRGGEPIPNAELWQMVYAFIKRYKKHLTFKWIRGHNGNEFNERADARCKEYLKKAQEPLTPFITVAL